MYLLFVPTLSCKQICIQNIEATGTTINSPNNYCNYPYSLNTHTERELGQSWICCAFCLLSSILAQKKTRTLLLHNSIFIRFRVRESNLCTNLIVKHGQREWKEWLFHYIWLCNFRFRTSQIIGTKREENHMRAAFGMAFLTK